jgi:putative transposase
MQPGCRGRRITGRGMDPAARDAEVITALQAIVIEEQRWGFWKCRDRLRAQGYGWNHKRIWRVYCQLRLNLPRRTKRRVPQRVRQPLLVEPRMNAVWALDFMRDTLYSGRVFRTLNVIDEANRGALGIDVAVSIPATRVTSFLTQMVDLHGRPSAIRCDNGPELTSQAFTDRCKEQAIALRFIRPIRTRTSSASTALTVRKCSARTCSIHWQRYAKSPRIGSTATTRSGHTMRWEACRQHVTASVCSKRNLQIKTVYLTGKLTDPTERMSKDGSVQSYH